MKFEAEDPSEVTKAGGDSSINRSQGAARAISVSERSHFIRWQIQLCHRCFKSPY